jgi:serine phosphatase RsbU (regulator of sigma subunit)
LSKIDSYENLKQVAIIQNIFLDNSSNLDDLEIFFKPKHIASADFFLIEPTEEENHIYVVVGDCVGHGLPGAFLSIFFANEVKNALKKEAIDSSLISIYNKIEHNVFSSEFYTKIDSFTSTDFTIIRINTNTKNIEFASNNQNFISYDGTKNEIYEPTNDTTFAGIKSSINSKKIISGNFNAENKQLILFSDGIINQFGGKKQKKLKRRYLYQLITSSKVFKENKCSIKELFNNYKDKEEQTDDCVWLSFKV